MSYIRAVWNTLVKFINFVLDHAYSLLPPSPFEKYISMVLDNEYLGYINYFFPIDTYITIAEAWIMAIAIYILYGVIIKWAKIVET